jgi:tetratricopeptide (TPR) repeat protein
MSDPLRSDQRPITALTPSEREARIEQLLLSGLDRYFAGDYEQAINLWTRVLFVDRQHDRARAYIERARSAQAEQQRESEAMAHEGLEAFKLGDVDRARDLLSAALDRGAPQELALGVLGRIERLDTAQLHPLELPLRRELTPVRSAREERRTTRRPGSGLLTLLTGCVLITLIGLSAFIALGGSVGQLTTWMVWPKAPILAASTLPSRPAAPLPVPAASEVHLSRAQHLYSTGRLRDALTALDEIPIGDQLRPDADRLRAQIQRELLTTTVADPLSAPPVPAVPPREPRHE